MSQAALISIVALAGWLVLVVGAFRARRVGARKTVVLALTWAAIFVAAALAASVIRR